MSISLSFKMEDVLHLMLVVMLLFRNGSSNSPSTSLGALVSELGTGVKFDASQLSQAAKEWLDARVTEQVIFSSHSARKIFIDPYSYHKLSVNFKKFGLQIISNHHCQT